MNQCDLHLLEIKQEPEETIIDVPDHEYLEFIKDDPQFRTFGSYMSKREVQENQECMKIPKTMPGKVEILQQGDITVCLTELVTDNVHTGARTSKAKPRARRIRAPQQRMKTISKSGICGHCNKFVRNFEKHSKMFCQNLTISYCDFCNFTTKYQTNMVMHVKAIHTLEKNYKCHLCSKIFNHPSNRNRHIKAVHKTKEFRYKCQFCTDISFSRSDNLNLHLRRIHGTVDGCKSKEIFFCDRCGVSFLTKVSLKSHMKTHTESPKPKFTFTCHICNEEFHQKFLLINHIAGYHSNVFTCRYCSKIYRSSRTQRCHESKCQN